MMNNFIADFRKRRNFLKSYRAKWSRKQVAFFQVRTVKGAEFNRMRKIYKRNYLKKESYY